MNMISCIHCPTPFSEQPEGVVILVGPTLGRVNTGTSELSVARMTSPRGWEEPAQTPEFDPVLTLALSGILLLSLVTMYSAGHDFPGRFEAHLRNIFVAIAIEPISL